MFPRLRFLAACCVVSCALSAAAGQDVPAPNRLIHESSPYLRQHAHNPVDWYPWGPEAFARARAENKPIFLSIGYSTCHWCHVMERESFRDAEVAALLNEHFVCIKVDREERPDVDRVHLLFLQASTGEGGWPLNVWLTPDLQPFFGGTYFAPESSAGRPGFKVLISRLADLWARQPERVVEQASRMLAALADDTAATVSAQPVDVGTLRRRCLESLRETYDEINGGFQQAPKFPDAAIHEFLFDVAATANDAATRDSARQLALTSLRAMAAGGLHDQLGGGFHRYAVDAAWRVPHFEKMLYDQAQLASVYLTGWLVSRDPLMRHTAERILDYVQQQLTDPAGGFYSAEDAESVDPGDPGRRAEGAFYTWTEAEWTQVLGPDDASLAARRFGVEPAGNVAAGVAPELAVQNVLFQARTVAALAQELQLPEEEVARRLAGAEQKLREVRAQRVRPSRDEKVITAWNGLMISAFARGAQVLQRPDYAATAARAAQFVRDHLFDPASARLARSYHAGRQTGPGFAEDYAFLIQALLDLYETTFEPEWIDWAQQLQERQDALFWDPAGGYFATTGEDPSVLLRLKERHDGVEPAASSVAVRNLARLAGWFHRDQWLERAQQTVQGLSAEMEREPAALPWLLAAAGWLEQPPQQIILHGEREEPVTRTLLATIRERFLPRQVLIHVDAGSRSYWQSRVGIIEALPSDPVTAGTVYVCENFTCQLPTSDPAVLVRQLQRAATVRP